MDIQIEHLDKAYGENHVLKDFCAVIPEGEITCIMAPSGKGKTTLLNILLGLEPYDRGRIQGLEGRKKSAVFQEDRLCENLSSRANIRMVRERKISGSREFSQKMEEGLEALELKGYRYSLKNPQVKRLKLAMLKVTKGDYIFILISVCWAAASFGASALLGNVL